MTKKILGACLAGVIILAVYFVGSAWMNSGGNENFATNLQPTMDSNKAAAMINEGYQKGFGEALAAMNQRQGASDPAALDPETEKLINQGAAMTAGKLSLNFHEKALEVKGLDPASAARYAKGMHVAGTVDKGFYEDIKADQKSLLNYLTKGADASGENTGAIADLGEEVNLTTVNTLANTAANIRRDPNSDVIMKYVDLDQLAEYGRLTGTTGKMNKTSFENEMAAVDKKNKKLSSRIWTNKKALAGFSGKGLVWGKNVTGRATMKASNISFRTE